MKINLKIFTSILLLVISLFLVSGSANGQYVDNHAKVNKEVADTSLFFEDWEVDTAINNWTVIDKNGDNITWFKTNYDGAYGSSSITYPFAHITAEDWLISPDISLKADRSYRVTFRHENSNAIAQSLKVFVGAGNTVANQTTLLLDLPVIDNRDSLSIVFTIPSDGLYNLGFNCYSKANTIGSLSLDNIRVQEEKELGTPSAITDLKQVPGTNGALTMGLTWTNPLQTIGGNVLSEITSINIYKDAMDTPIVFTDSLTPGGNVVWNDPDLVEGAHEYIVSVINTYGESYTTKVNTFIGTDLPGKPLDLNLTVNGNEATLNWSGIDEFGAQGGWYDSDNLEYRIIRNPGNVVLETNFKGAMSYVDNTISSLGMYSYTLAAKNADGVGVSAISNTQQIGAISAFPFIENWEDKNTMDLWKIVDANEDGYTWKRSLDRGAEEPSCIYYSTKVVGDYVEEWLFSPKFEFDTAYDYRIKFYFKTHILQWETMQVTIGKDATPAAQKNVILDMTEVATADAYVLQSASFSVENKGIYNLGFLLSYSGNDVYIDNITIEKLLGQDMKALSIKGSTAPTLNKPTSNVVSVLNNGTNSIASYSVQLLDVENNVLATKEITRSLGAGKTNDIDITWTPTVKGNFPIKAKVVMSGDLEEANNVSDLYSIVVQPENISVVTIGDETLEHTGEIPLNAYSFTFCESVYLASDLGDLAGDIQYLAYKVRCGVKDLKSQPLKIWMGETLDNSLNSGWIPATDMTLVYDGDLNIPQGTYDLLIPLNNHYSYKGGNLVVLIDGQGEFGDVGDWGLSFFSSEYNKAATRHIGKYYDNDPYNPDNANGVFSDKIPNTMFFVDTENMGSLSGRVYLADGTTPVKGVRISANNAFFPRITDISGYFKFPYIQSGEVDISTSFAGYKQVSKKENILAGKTTDVRFSLQELSKVDVNGVVVGSDDLDSPLAGARIQLLGSTNYETMSNADGTFSLSNVYGDTSYIVKISKLNYIDYTAKISLGSNTFELDTIVIKEMANAPTAVRAYDKAKNALVTWTKPVTPRWIAKDDGVAYGYFGSNGDGIYSVAHRYTPSDLEALVIDENLYVTQIEIYVGAVAKYTLKIWSGVTGSETEIYSEEIDPTIDAWSIHTLKTPIPINVNQNLLVGYEVEQSAGVSPVGFDKGPAIENGDVFWDGSVWTTAAEITSGHSNYNWCIHAFCGINSNSDPVVLEKAAVVTNNQDQKQDFSKGFSFMETKTLNASINNVIKVNKPLRYEIFRFINGNESDESAWIQLDTTNLIDTFFIDNTWQPLYDTVYRYAVRALYSENFESDETFSNGVDKGKYAEVTLKVTTNASSPEGAKITLSNKVGKVEGFVSEDSIALITDVYFGIFTLTIDKPGYKLLEVDSIVINENVIDLGSFKILEDTRPPQKPEVVDLINNSVISWFEPSITPPQWLHKDNGKNEDGFGMNEGGTMIVGQRYSSEELQKLELEGFSVTKIRIFPVEDADYKLKIWSGVEGEIEIYSQNITVTPGKWNEYILDNPVAINVTNNLYIGYSVIHKAGIYPCGFDNTKHLPGGDMINFNGVWYSAFDEMMGLADFNWNIQAYCNFETGSNKLALVKTNTISTLNKEINNKKTDFLPISLFGYTQNITHSNSIANDFKVTSDKVTPTYKVWRLLEGNENTTTSWTLLTTNTISETKWIDEKWFDLADANYKYAICAKYTNENYSDTVFTNIAEKGKSSSVSLKVETNNAYSAEGAIVELKNINNNVDNVYTGIIDASNGLNITPVYRGTYNLSITKAGYSNYRNTKLSINTNYPQIDVITLKELLEAPQKPTAVDQEIRSVVSWYNPGSYVAMPGWIYWDKNRIQSGLGSSSGAANFNVAQMFTPDDLVAMKVKSLNITKVSIFLISANEVPTDGNFTLKIWEGTDNPSITYSQEIIDPEFNTWTEIELTTPYPINATDNLWIGYNCNLTEGYPAGFDFGPQVAGKGNLMELDGTWYQLSEVSPDLNVNWAIHTYCDESETESTKSILLRQDISRNISEGHIDDFTIANEFNSYFNAFSGDTKNGMIDNSVLFYKGFNVYRLLAGNENNEDLWTLLTEKPITDTIYNDNAWNSLEDGKYKYAVKAVYESDNSEAVFTDTLPINKVGNNESMDIVGGLIYPNPNNGQFFIELSEPTSIFIYNLEGKLVYSEEQISKSAINLNLQVNSGLYTIKMVSKRNISYGKIIVK